MWDADVQARLRTVFPTEVSTVTTKEAWGCGTMGQEVFMLGAGLSHTVQHLKKCFGFVVELP